MVGEGVVHGVGHPGPELKLRVHLCPALRGDCVVNFRAVLLSEILALVVFEGFSWIDVVLFT